MEEQQTSAARRIAVLLPSLEGGGAERSMLHLVRGFLARGRQVDLVLCKTKGAYLREVPATAQLVELKASFGLLARLSAALENRQDLSVLLRPVLLAKKNAPEVARVRALRHYLEERRPDVVLSALTYCNLAALWAKRTSRVQVPVVVSERNVLSNYCAAPSNNRKWRWRYLPELVRRTYPGADAVVAVSRQVAEDLLTRVKLQHRQLDTIFNPVVDDTLRRQAREPLNHPWFAPGNAPVILGVGRLTEQKDFATLVHAVAKVRATRDVKLVLLGEGRLQGELQKLARGLGIGDDVDMPGFVDNPFQYMARASLLVLSSEYEGLPGVLIQAMACGCPVISTDCPGGSREILDDGKYGALVAIGDAQGMARAIAAALDCPVASDTLLHRAEDFSVEHAVSNYLALLDHVVAGVGRVREAERLCAG